MERPEWPRATGQPVISSHTWQRANLTACLAPAAGGRHFRTLQSQPKASHGRVLGQITTQQAMLSLKQKSLCFTS